MKFISISFLIMILAVGFVCSFTSKANAGTMTLPCTLVVEKIEVPSTGTFFNFDITGTLEEQFSLQNEQRVDVVMDIDNQLTIREDIPEGYSLDIECTPGVTNCGSEVFVPCLNIVPLEDGTGVFVECLDNDTGSCTFTNRLNASPAEVPTLSEWGLIAMAGVLGLIAFFVIRRKKAVA